MNTSAVSVYDNVNTMDILSKSGIYNKLNDLLNVNTDLEVRIYCPLCVKSFGFKFSLFEHLRTFHDSFLNQASNQTLRFAECPFCNAKFYGKHLTAKHVLHDHTKVVRGLFVNKNRFKCCFCNVKLIKEDLNSILKHIENLHFLEFEEEFNKMFSCDATQELSMSEFINSSVENENLGSANWEDVCMNVGKNSGKKCDADTKNFDEASVVNCYDFTELKQQLENIKGTTNSGANSTSKSILKDVRNTRTHRRSARRVLRFDLPSDTEDKENLVLQQNYPVLKQINFKEHSLLCENKTDEFVKSNETFCEEPQHSSTPNTKSVKYSKNENQKNHKPTFKSYIAEKNVKQFEFQCGKCRLLFKENLELVSHVKNNHRKLSLIAFQPRYHCAICNAKFYKNRYLRKHHNLHKPY